MTITRVIGVAALAAALVFAPGGAGRSLASDEGHGGAPRPGGGSAPAEMPQTAAALWQAIDADTGRLDQTIREGKLADVHKIAFQVRDLAQALPAKSTDLPEDKQKVLRGLVERVGEHAKNLDAYGDAGKAKETAEEFAQLKKRLDYMRQLYPSLPATPPTGHERHGREGQRGHDMDAGQAQGPGAAAAGGAGEQTAVVGEIVDSHCYLTRGTQGMGQAHRDCAARCISEGRPPLVRDELTGALYLAAAPAGKTLDRKRLLANVGQRVRVAGDVVERDGFQMVQVAEIIREHDHEAAPHGGVIGMIGDRHIEVVPGAAGDLRVYVLDAFLKPMRVDGVTGTAVLASKDGAQRSGTLAVDVSGEFLVVRDAAVRRDDEDVTVDLQVAGDNLKMTLPFPDPNAAGGGEAQAQHHHY